MEERESLKLERVKFGRQVGPKLDLNYDCITPHKKIKVNKYYG
jgi:hypothetical protein